MQLICVYVLKFQALSSQVRPLPRPRFFLSSLPLCPHSCSMFFPHCLPYTFLLYFLLSFTSSSRAPPSFTSAHRPILMSPPLPLPPLFPPLLHSRCSHRIFCGWMDNVRVGLLVAVWQRGVGEGKGSRALVKGKRGLASEDTIVDRTHRDQQDVNAPLGRADPRGEGTRQLTGPTWTLRMQNKTTYRTRRRQAG